MIKRMNDAQRRLLAVGLAVLLVVVLVAGFAVPAWLGHRHYNRALADYGDQLARHQRVAATREATEAKLAALRGRQLNTLYLKNPSPTIAASELQDIARSAIEAAGARLITVQIPPHRDEGRYRQVTINVNISATGPALRRILHSLESAQPLMVIENVTIRQSVGAGFRPAPGTEPEMFVQFELSGYAIGGGK
jgi:general secretion pathway protein M